MAVSPVKDAKTRHDALGAMKEIVMSPQDDENRRFAATRQ